MVVDLSLLNVRMHSPSTYSKKKKIVLPRILEKKKNSRDRGRTPRWAGNEGNRERAWEKAPGERAAGLGLRRPHHLHSFSCDERESGLRSTRACASARALSSDSFSLSRQPQPGSRAVTSKFQAFVDTAAHDYSIREQPS